MKTLRSLPRLAPWVIQDAPWGFPLRLKIWKASRPEFVSATEELLARRAHADAMRRNKAQFVVQTAAAGGRVLSKGKQLEAADKAARVASGSVDEFVELIHNMGKSEVAKLTANHLFEIVEGNLYGVPLADSVETRLKLLTDLQHPAEGQGSGQWHTRNGGPPEPYHMPSHWPVDPDLEDEWVALIAESSVAEAIEQFSGSVAPTPYFHEALGEDDDSEMLLLQDLIAAWITTVAKSSAAFLPGAQAEVADFLPDAPEPTSS